MLIWMIQLRIILTGQKRKKNINTIILRFRRGNTRPMSFKPEVEAPVFNSGGGGGPMSAADRMAMFRQAEENAKKDEERKKAREEERKKQAEETARQKAEAEKKKKEEEEQRKKEEQEKKEQKPEMKDSEKMKFAA